MCFSQVKYLGGSILTEGPWIGGNPPPGMTYGQYAEGSLKTIYANSPAVASAVMEFYKFNGTNEAEKYWQLIRDAFFMAGSESLAKAVVG